MWTRETFGKVHLYTGPHKSVISNVYQCFYSTQNAIWSLWRISVCSLKFDKSHVTCKLFGNWIAHFFYNSFNKFLWTAQIRRVWWSCWLTMVQMLTQLTMMATAHFIGPQSMVNSYPNMATHSLFDCICKWYIFWIRKQMQSRSQRFCWTTVLM